MRQVLSDHIALVTGASSGIGAATAWELLRRGAHVVLAARRADELNYLVKQMSQAGYHAIAIPTDVRDPVQVRRTVDQMLERFGRIDVVVNNAGVGWETSFAETSVEDMNRVVDSNLRGAMLMTQAVLPTMLQQRRGTLIFIASVAGHIAVDPLYSASKFGLRGFALALRRELKSSGVSSSLVSPGFIRTAMNEHMRHFPLPMPSPEVIAPTIANLVSHPHREVIIPHFYYGLIGVEHLFPWLADIAIRHGRASLVHTEKILPNNRQ
jgi:NAD(P)-dependent dehydrogenase (short-subunit alcohol dehydrogenase family)